MDWSLLLLLACPLMMLLCMKGMFSGNKEKEKAKGQQNVQSETSGEDLQTLQIRMADLMEQNEELKKEVQSMKESRSTNVLDLNEGQEKSRKAEIS